MQRSARKLTAASRFQIVWISVILAAGYALLSSAGVFFVENVPRYAAIGADTSMATNLTTTPTIRIASVVAPNGDRNPYGIAVVPLTAGKLVKGNLLVDEFDNSNSSAGAGTTILQVDPSTGATSVFYSGSPVAGPVGVAINPVNDGVWIGDYGSAENGTSSNDLLINAAGTLVATFTNSTTNSAASFLGVWGQGVSDANGVVSFYWGNAGNATTGTGGGDVWRLTPHPTGPKNGQPVNSDYAQIANGQAGTAAGGNASTAAGPQGLAYDSMNGVLYETNDASNTLYAIPSAATLSSPITASVVYQGPALDSPENVVINPVNGDLLVANGAGNNNLVEITPSGQVVRTIDLAPNQAPGALFGLAVSSNDGNPILYFGNDDNNTINALYLKAISGTSPTITSLPQGGFEVAFQANTGALWTVGAGPGSVDANWNLGMM